MIETHSMINIYIVILLSIAIILYSIARKEARVVEYGHRTLTQRGEQVRSYAESEIANYLDEKGIKYEYEQRIRGIGRPDFYLPDYDVFVEYWGLVNADNEAIRKRYEKTMKWKMAQYHSRDIKFISIYPQNLSNLDWVFKKKFEDVTGKTLH